MMLDTVEHHEIDHAAAAGSAVQHVPIATTRRAVEPF
jgi:hypothetical protein